MYRPQVSIDRTLANGRWTRPDRRDYNAPVTGQHPRWHRAQPSPARIDAAFRDLGSYR